MDYLPCLNAKSLFNIHFSQKTLSVDRFSKILQVLLRQIEISMLTRIYFSCSDLTNFFFENSVSDVRFLNNRFTKRIFCLFGLMLYVHGQQLMSCRYGKLSYPHCSEASLPEAGHQYLAHILSPLTDNCSS